MGGGRKPKEARLLTGAVKAVAEFESKAVDLINEEFGELAGCGAATLERYRGGRPLRDPLVVRPLAEAIVRRGFFGPFWLRQFLQATAYPHPEALVAELFPGGAPVPPATPHTPAAPALWFDNLETAAVPRPLTLHRDALKQLLGAFTRTRLVVLLGIGGVGKTSLAFQLATLCRDQRGEGGSAARLQVALPPVQAIVWASDKDSPGSLTLAALHDQIARTMGYPGLSALGPAERDVQVRQLLAERPTLLIVDNAETVADRPLLLWLLDLPPGARALLTTRRLAEPFHTDGVSVVTLGGMDGPDARRLIAAQSSQIGYQHGRNRVAQTALVQRTGGNPHAIKQILGYARRTSQPLEAVVEQFDALTGDLLADLFARLWDTLLDEPARQLLLALTLFHQPASRTALGQVAALEEPTLGQAIDRLHEVALLNEHERVGALGQPRFGLHPLTRAYVRARSAAHPAFVDAAEQRLVDWAVTHATNFGYLLNDPERLGLLAADATTLREAVALAACQGRPRAVVQLVKGLEFFFYIGCRWEEKLELHEAYIAAAVALASPAAQVDALTMHIQLLCRLNRPAEAEPFLEGLKPLEGATTGEERFHLLHARALYHYTRREHRAAQEHWTTIAEGATAWGLPEHMRIGVLHWLGMSMIGQGDYKQASTLLLRSLKLARGAAIGRWVARNLLQLAHINVSEGDLRTAQQRLQETVALLAESDWEQRAQLRRVEALLWRASGQPDLALRKYAEARDLFSRMGLLHELQEEEQHFKPRDLGSGEPGAKRQSTPTA